jgi:hypothetical protein
VYEQNITIHRDVAEACTADLLGRLQEMREERDTWRDIAQQAIHRVAGLTHRVEAQTMTIRRLTAELRAQGVTSRRAA